MTSGSDTLFDEMSVLTPVTFFLDQVSDSSPKYLAEELEMTDRELDFLDATVRLRDAFQESWRRQEILQERLSSAHETIEALIGLSKEVSDLRVAEIRERIREIVSDNRFEV